jgi:hypothetical protein
VVDDIICAGDFDIGRVWGPETSQYELVQPEDALWPRLAVLPTGWSWSLWFCRSALTDAMVTSESQRLNISKAEASQQLLQDRNPAPRVRRDRPILAPYVWTTGSLLGRTAGLPWRRRSDFAQNWTDDASPTKWNATGKMIFKLGECRSMAQHFGSETHRSDLGACATHSINSSGGSDAVELPCVWRQDTLSLSFCWRDQLCRPYRQSGASPRTTRTKLHNFQTTSFVNSECAPVSCWSCNAT